MNINHKKEDNMEEKEFEDLWQQMLLISSERQRQHPEWRWGSDCFQRSLF